MINSKNNMVSLSEAQQKARRSRSLAIALALGALVIAFYAVALVKGVGFIANRPL